MHPQWSAEAEGRYQERLLEQQRSGYRTATLLAVVLFPAFSLLDLLTQRQAFATLSLIRFSTSIVFAALHLAARRNRYPAGPYLSGVLLLILASSSITAMCLVLDGYRSPYYAGVNLVVLAGVLLFPWTARRMTAAVSIVIGIWLLGTLVQCGFHVDRPDLLINNSYFLIATGVIGVAAAGLGDRLRREAFAWGEAKSALELRDQFVSIASHELRTPITSLKLQLDLMRRRALKESASGGEAALRTTQSIDRLGGQVQRLTHLVDQMLDLSRVRSGRLALEPQPIDLRELLTQVLGQLSDEFAQAGVEVTLHKPDAPVEGSWD